MLKKTEVLQYPQAQENSVQNMDLSDLRAPNCTLQSKQIKKQSRNFKISTHLSRVAYFRRFQDVILIHYNEIRASHRYVKVSP